MVCDQCIVGVVCVKCGADNCGYVTDARDALAVMAAAFADLNIAGTVRSISASVLAGVRYVEMDFDPNEGLVVILSDRGGDAAAEDWTAQRGDDTAERVVAFLRGGT